MIDIFKWKTQYVGADYGKWSVRSPFTGVEGIEVNIFKEEIFGDATSQCSFGYHRTKLGARSLLAVHVSGSFFSAQCGMSVGQLYRAEHPEHRQMWFWCLLAAWGADEVLSLLQSHWEKCGMWDPHSVHHTAESGPADGCCCWNGKLSGPLLLSKGEAACEVLLNKNLLLSFPFPYWQHLFFFSDLFLLSFLPPQKYFAFAANCQFLLPSVEIGMILYFLYPSLISALCLFTFTVTGQELEMAEPGWDRCEEAVRSVWVLTPAVNGQLPSQFRPSSHTISICPGALAAEPCAGSTDCFRNRKCCERKLKE